MVPSPPCRPSRAPHGGSIRDRRRVPARGRCWLCNGVGRGSRGRCEGTVAVPSAAKHRGLASSSSFPAAVRWRLSRRRGAIALPRTRWHGDVRRFLWRWRLPQYRTLSRARGRPSRVPLRQPLRSPRAGTARAALCSSAHAPVPPHVLAPHSYGRERRAPRRTRPAALPAPHRPDALRAALGRAPSSLLLVAGAPAGGFGGAEWRGAPSVSAARHGTPVLLSQQSGAAAALPALPAPLRAAEPSPPAAPGHGRSAESRPPPRRRPLNGAPRDAIPPSPPASPAAPRRSCRRSAG